MNQYELSPVGCSLERVVSLAGASCRFSISSRKVRVSVFFGVVEFPSEIFNLMLELSDLIFGASFDGS